MDDLEQKIESGRVKSTWDHIYRLRRVGSLSRQADSGFIVKWLCEEARMPIRIVTGFQAQLKVKAKKGRGGIRLQTEAPLGRNNQIACMLIERRLKQCENEGSVRPDDLEKAVAQARIDFLGVAAAPKERAAGEAHRAAGLWLFDHAVDGVSIRLATDRLLELISALNADMVNLREIVLNTDNARLVRGTKRCIEAGEALPLY